MEHTYHEDEGVRFQFKVRGDCLQEYKEHLKHVWTEMLDTLRETVWHSYSFAQTFVTFPDLLYYRLSGEITNEFTSVTTTQCLGPF